MPTTTQSQSNKAPQALLPFPTVIADHPDRNQAGLDSEACWQAVQERDRGRDGEFVFAVKTTGVFCRPSCGARLPLRKNVAFFPTIEKAAAAGFRPCKRCRPTEYADGAARVARLCEYIRDNADSGDKLGLEQLSQVAGLSKSHLQRIFRAAVGVSPRQYVEAVRLGALKRELRSGETVTDAIYAAGFGASSRLYERASSRLGMTPRQYGQGGQGLAISYTVLDSRFGKLLLAATDRGLCFVELGEEDNAMVAALRREFPKAKVAAAATPHSPELERWAAALERHLEGQTPQEELPLDVRASAFQFQVWSYLQTIPRGEVRTYQEVAAAIGKPKAVRAVGSACGKNPTALVVPCHRVIRGDGGLGGYRWGEDRKRQILLAEGVMIA